jgi:aerobic carbon-monoxide dehydrogenase medium subunit
VRNWGTIGGSLCQADPSEDLSAAFATMKGSMIIRGLDGTRSDTGRDTTREVSARAFHTGPYETVVGPAEMLTEIRLPIKSGGGSAYLKVSRRAGDWPVGAVGAAVWLSRPNSRKHHVITDVGIGLTALGATHFVAVEAEEFLRGKSPDNETLQKAGEIAASHCRPVSDQRGPADYKRHLAQELTTRALRQAVDRALKTAT